MDSDIEKYYEEYNFPSADKIYKLMKNDGYDIDKKILYHIYLKNKRSNNLRKLKRVN